MKLQVIVGSIRQGRKSDKVAAWVATAASDLKDSKVEVVDLADYPLPIFDEDGSPQFNPSRRPVAAAQRWLNKLSEADAYVIVTPEYNRSIPGALKNALDYLDFQLANKPVALVAHGSIGGAAAVANLRNVVPQLKAVTIPSVAYVMGHATSSINESGELTDEDIKNNPYGPQAALHALLDELKWYSDALAAHRNTQAPA